MATEFSNERFSIFPCGWWDEAEQKAKPQQRQQQTQTISWVYEYIISERARKATEELRQCFLRLPDSRNRTSKP